MLCRWGYKAVAGISVDQRMCEQYVAIAATRKPAKAAKG
jgi:hypothetical protein